MRIGLLTGGGDCAGLNAAIAPRCARVRPTVMISLVHHGWRVSSRRILSLTTTDTKGILQSGGTILRTLVSTPRTRSGVAAVLRT